MFFTVKYHKLFARRLKYVNINKYTVILVTYYEIILKIETALKFIIIWSLSKSKRILTTGTKVCENEETDMTFSGMYWEIEKFRYK